MNKKERHGNSRMWKEKLRHFLTGRYGMDNLSRFLLAAAAVLLVIGLFVRWTPIYWIGFLLLMVVYLRMFSGSHDQRSRENQFYLRVKARVVGFWRRSVDRVRQSRDYHFFRCPNCRTTVRIPRGKGKVLITCPKCRNQFLKKS